MPRALIVDGHHDQRWHSVNFGSSFTARCTCGWYRSGFASEKRAERAAKDHEVMHRILVVSE